MEIIEQNLEKLWGKNKNHHLTASEMLMYLFLTYQWKKNNYQNFTYSDYEITKELKLSRQTVIKIKQKLMIEKLLEFSHCPGMTTVYSFYDTDIKEPPKPTKRNNIENSSTNKDEFEIPTKKEFISYVKTLHNYKEQFLSDVMKEYDYLEKNNWVTKRGKVESWLTIARISMSKIVFKYNTQKAFDQSKNYK